MTDLEIIKQIEKELNIELKKVDKIEWNTKGYIINELDKITSLGLWRCEIKDLNRIINFLKDLTSLTSLNLSDNQISDISTLKDLRNITKLELSNNHIPDISLLKDLLNLTILNLSLNFINDISVVKHLKYLKTLDLSQNKVANILFIESCKNLKVLNLFSNQISNITSISKLINLEELDISSNFVSDISHISNLKRIKKLNLSENQISILPKLDNLNNIESLGLNKNYIEDFSTLNILKSLKSLSLNNNKISNINIIEDLVNLTFLEIINSNISELKFLKNLKNLNTLFLNNNNISDIYIIQDLKMLKMLDLRNNKIKIIENWICKFSEIEIKYSDVLWGGSINLYNNPLQSPPLEIVKQGKQAIKNYFASIKVENKELKLILLGNTTAGKTSLVQYLTERIYPPKKSTHGINLSPWQPKEEEYDFTASIWDFGGQEYYHATHRLFLTNNAFYILLWDKNKNQTAILDTDIYLQKGILENKPLQHFHYEYWLKLIRKQFAPNAEIITVQNKTDISGKEIIAQQTVDNYKIKEQYQISIEETANGITKQKRKYTDFEEDLKDYITEFIKSKAPEGEEAGKIQRYIDNIRKAIRNNWQENYLSFTNFNKQAKEVAKKGGDEIDDFSIEVALKYLHDTGVLLYYGYEASLPNSILQDYVFISPNYVTGTIYNILDEDNVQKNGGKFNFEHVKKSVNTEKEAELFIALMQSPNFELIFEYDGFYYASQFLPETNPVIDYQKNSLYFAFSLRFPNFFSASFITRFIARYGIQAKNNAFCRTGIILKRDNIDFYISADIDKETIIIKTIKDGKKHRFIRKIYDIFLEFAYSDKNILLLVTENGTFASLEEIERLGLEKYKIERLFKPLAYETIINGNKIKVEGNGNIILQDVEGRDITINVNDLSDIEQKLSNEHSQILSELAEIKQNTQSFDIADRLMELIEKQNNENFIRILQELKTIIVSTNKPKYKINKETTTKIKALQKALLSAFPDPNILKQMFFFATEKNIHEITANVNLDIQTFDIITWSISNNKIKELIAGAKEQNSGNYLLKQIDENDYEFTENNIEKTK